eukprot:CAMPEP_0115252168 /NCGR_PEP_ID=MMETSP0270-20121206/44007_1 /TAXON_ID=71861 /ORGANISM="Scrippsiella trochoidea, Strain CCMP3099" /LENGTH=49 /DNA_ID=CAMNT_0002667613 /DNA_START=139 /DNA_END=288 /DNA_ORIENTATION=-
MGCMTGIGFFGGIVLGSVFSEKVKPVYQQVMGAIYKQYNEKVLGETNKQ